MFSFVLSNESFSKSTFAYFKFSKWNENERNLSLNEKTIWKFEKFDFCKCENWKFFLIDLNIRWMKNEIFKSNHSDENFEFEKFCFVNDRIDVDDEFRITNNFKSNIR